MTTTRPDVVGRIEADCLQLGITEKDLLATARIAPAFLSKARAGGCSGDRSDPTWKKLIGTLDRLMKSSSLTAAVDPQPTSVAPQGGPPLVLGLVAAIEAASTPQALEDLTRCVLRGLATGTIEPNAGRVLLDGVSRQQQILSLKLEQQERAKAGKPITVTIRYVNSWRNKVGSQDQAGGGP